MKKQFLTTIAVFSISAPLAAQVHGCREIGGTRNEVINRSVTLCAESMTVLELSQWAQQHLGTLGDSSRIREVIASTDEQELRRSVLLRASYSHQEAGFEINLRTLFSFGRQPLLRARPVVRVTAIAGDVVLETFMGGTTSQSYVPAERQVLKGARDPLRNPKNDSDLLWIEPVWSDVGRWRAIHAFVFSGKEVNCAKCTEVLTDLRLVLSGITVDSMQVRMRRDAWFDGEEFPLIFRFRPPIVDADRVRAVLLQNVPTVEHYYAGQEVSCSSDSARRCVYSGRWSFPGKIKP